MKGLLLKALLQTNEFVETVTQVVVAKVMSNIERREELAFQRKSHPKVKSDAKKGGLVI